MKTATRTDKAMIMVVMIAAAVAVAASIVVLIGCTKPAKPQPQPQSVAPPSQCPVGMVNLGVHPTYHPPRPNAHTLWLRVGDRDPVSGTTPYLECGEE